MVLILLFIFIIGLVIGSFLNVVILRTLSNESIIFPPSKCPKCQTPLKWWHNIPVLSYVFLRGKCAFCREKISIQYPIVELLTGLIFSLLGYLYLNVLFATDESIPLLTIMFLVSVIASSLFIVISGTDFIEMLVSEKHLYSLIALGLIYSVIIGGLAFYGDYKFGIANWGLFFTPILYTLGAIIMSFLLLEILRRCANFLIKTETFGDGDSYIFAGIAGVITSLFRTSDFRYLLVILFIIFLLSVILSVIFTLPLYIKRLFIEKKWYLTAILSIFIVYSTGYFYANANEWFYNEATSIVSTIILVALGLLLCIEMLIGIKNGTQTGTQIPFGPSLCVAGLISLIIFPILLAIV